MAVRVVQLSDTHLSPRRAYAVRNVRTVLAAIAADGPDVVVHTGDMAADDPDDREERAFAAGVLATVAPPLLAIPGNHDVGGFSAPGFGLDRLAGWQEVWGEDTFVHDLGRWRLVGANVYRLGEDDHDRQLRSRLATSRPTLLFLHQPVCLVDPDEPDDGEDKAIGPRPRSDLMPMLADSCVKVVASGHLHRYRLGRLPDGPATVWCPAASFVGTPDDDSRYVVGAVEHVLHDDGRAEQRLLRPEGLTDLRFHDLVPPGSDTLGAAPPLPLHAVRA